MRQMRLRNGIKKVRVKTMTWFVAIYTFLLTQSTAFAEEIGSSKLATGTEKLITDLTTWLMILSPVITVLLVIYYLIRKSAADEMDAKKWNNRIVVALVSCVGAVLSSAIVNLLVGYYK